MLKWLLLFSASLFGVSMLTARPASAQRPDVVFIMVDDLGYSDLGCYGGEIETPHLDSLAAGGVRFAQFYNTAKCHSSRVSLLTGQYCIAAGDESLRHAVTSAEVLRESGYFTAMTGKWHLRQEPTDFGFDRYFGHLSGACNYFTGDNSFRLNGKPWKVPAEGFYTTVANVDHALKFLTEANGTQQPSYLYIAFNAPHAPLQALPQDYAKYQGRYDVGWDAIRAGRVAKQKALGLLGKDLTPSERPEHVPAWDTLSDKRKAFEVKRMTTLAAMIDRVDQEVGRLKGELMALGELENTLIWFVSDNGACPYDRRSQDIDSLPTDGSVSWSDSTGWAWVRNSPFRYYKQNQFEGGISTPAIVHWPDGLQTEPGSILQQPAHLIDVLPTLADITQSPIPTQWEGRALRPISGQSLRPLFQGGSIVRAEPIHFLFNEDRALRDGDWKAVSYRGEAWELYNLADDRTERNDLSAVQHTRLQSMVDRWTEMAATVLHASGRTIAPVGPAKLPHKHPEWTDFSRDPAEVAPKRSRNPAGPAGASGQPLETSLRARKNTRLSVSDQQMHLKFTGDDPGITIGWSSPLPRGPYRLNFRLKRKATGDGELFFTTDAKTTLPRGVRVTFPLGDRQDWQTVEIPLQTAEALHALRIDVSDAVGEASIADLNIQSATGETLWHWQPTSGLP